MIYYTKIFFKKISVLISNFFDLSNIKRIKFRTDINGLRAISVLSVVFYHAGILNFNGGWLGVDVFFVISGFLISNIIISEINTNSFKFRIFYKRRIYRILPGLFTIVIFSIVFSLFLLSPKALYEFLNSSIATLLFFSNLYFSNLDFYTAESTKFMPFLHMWSLSIEEQFYFLFPLLTAIIYKKFNKLYFTFISLTIFISIYINTIFQNTEKFYLIQFRAWELLTGVFITLVYKKINIKYSEVIGIIMLFFSIFYFDDFWINDIEPKLISIIGVSLILLKTENTYVSKFLSLKIFAIIGSASYSIYLLHQPIFAFFRIYFTEISWQNYSDNILNKFQIYLAIILILFLGFLNHKFVESYFIKFNNSKLLFFIGLSILFLIFSILKFQNKESLLLENKLFQYTVNENYYSAVQNGNNCHDITQLTQMCSFNTSEKQKVILLGDSHTKELGYRLMNELTEYNLIILTGNACLFLYEVEYFEGCPLKNDNDNIKNFVSNQSNVVFIYAGDIWDNRYDIFELEKNIPITLNKLLERNNSIIVLEQIPNLPFNPINKLSSNNFNLSNIENNFLGLDYNYWKNEKLKNPQLDIYKTIQSNNIYFIEPEKYLCNNEINNMCLAAIKDKIYYKDDNHLTIDGIDLFLNDLLNQIKIISND